jgi:hypothetical protein
MRPCLPAAVAAAAIALAGCMPPASPDLSRDGAQRPVPLRATKPPPARPSLPPGVTKVVNPDGSITITIREPRCPPCSPWEF